MALSSVWNNFGPSRIPSSSKLLVDRINISEIKFFRLGCSQGVIKSISENNLLKYFCTIHVLVYYYYFLQVQTSIWCGLQEIHAME